MPGKNLLKKIIRYLNAVPSSWGDASFIDAIMESRQKVKQKEQWEAQHLRRRELFQQHK